MYGKALITLLLVTLAAADCPGKRTYDACGGLSPEANRCDEGYRCISDPRTEGCGLACDEPGICVPDDTPMCGGYAALRCPRGLECFEDPTDDCDPENGGFDCSGLCL